MMPEKSKLLVVDDESLLLDLYKALLQSEGYTVITANSGEEALEICGDPENEIDGLITDIVMPGISGVVLAHKVKKFRGVDFKVLFMSGYNEALDEISLPEERRHFLKKPFSNSDLLSTVQELFMA
jgi:two-component system cell cycle sensor histidine kinase/response regulator CckA